MSEQISDQEARREIAEGSNTTLWRLAAGIDRNGLPFGENLSAIRVIDLLEVCETETWSRSTRKGNAKTELFQPVHAFPKDDGLVYRSFLPEDIRDEEEEAVRSFSTASHHALARARVHEVLWVRFKKYPDAVSAIGARFDAAPAGDAERDWPGLVKNLGRLTTLIVSVGAKSRLDELVAALEDARLKLRACTRPFAFPVLADMICNALFARKYGRDVFTAERAQAWIEDLANVAGKYRQDSHHGHDALVVMHAWQARWGSQEVARSVARDVVEQLREVAEVSGPSTAPWLRARALQAALDFGLADLTHMTRHQLMDSVKAAIPTFKQVSRRFDLPAELVAQIDSLVERSVDAADAVRLLALLPGLLEIDREQLHANAAEQLRDMPLLAHMPSVQYHPEGKITHRSDGPEGNVDRHVAFLVNMHLVIVEGLLRHFLAQTLARFGESTLFDALGQWPHLSESRQPLLQRASERFAARDWVSCGYIAATLFEAMLRDLLRASEYHALKAERDGTLMDETLNSLLRGEAARLVLGDGFCALAEHVLCDSKLGWNLRNDIAHGTVRPDVFSGSRVLLLWLLMVRLTCFVAKDKEDVVSDPTEVTKS